MQSLQKVLDWILISSNNPQEVSLTVKGALIAAVPTIMFIAGVAHYDLGSDNLTAVFDGLAAFIQAALTVIATAVALYGAVRKVWLTVFRSTSTQ